MTYLTFSQLERVGRLGNGLWQIASTIGLARRHGMEPRFPPSWSYRKFFSIPDEMFAEVRGTEAYRLPDLDHMDERTRIYLQDLSFLEGVEDEVREYFRPSAAAKVYIESALPGDRIPPTLVVHVRRGDNVHQQDCYPLPMLDYYLDAVRRHPSHDVVIFGDDDNWNRSALLPQVSQVTHQGVFCVTGVPRPKEHEPDYMSAPIFDWVDLFAMENCGYAFCLSNSTLGWWAAWLSTINDVCYPDPWYGPSLDIRQQGYIDGSLMMPSAWLKVAAGGGRREPRRGAA
jgi:hypothetical protein